MTTINAGHLSKEKHQQEQSKRRKEERKVTLRTHEKANALKYLNHEREREREREREDLIGKRGLLNGFFKICRSANESRVS